MIAEPSQRQLVSARLTLRPFEMSDLLSVHHYASDPAVTRYMDWGPNDDAATREFLEMASAPRRMSADDFHFAVVLSSVSELIGGCSIRIESRIHERASFGYVIAKEHWGNGFATEAALRLKDFAFDVLGVHRLEATCHPDNVASARVLTKTGLSLEGRMRDHMLIRGTWRDSLLFATANRPAE
jgi:RimJ/RimL family protein N-acetyltransferase